MRRAGVRRVLRFRRDFKRPEVVSMKRLFPQVELCQAIRELSSSRAAEGADLCGGEEDFLKAMEGCKYVMHTASPFKLDAKDVQKELIEPAVKGTEAVMKAAAKANIKRVVLTSSIAAVGPPMKWFQDGGDDKVWTEDDWNDEEPDNPVKGYRASKALAEKKAWELSKELNVDLAVICPGFVLGPMLSSRADGESVLFMKGMLETARSRKRRIVATSRVPVNPSPTSATWPWRTSAPWRRRRRWASASSCPARRDTRS
ncbi:unnamed protein product [Effrenium voratum]|nr:unnamed protein product [Effrenium voratum]